MARAIVCDGCDRLAEEPAEYFSVDHWGGEGYEQSIELCPSCIPEGIEELLDGDADSDGGEDE